MNMTRVSSVLRRVKRNINAGPLLHVAATGTVAFCLLIIGAFGIVYTNVSSMVSAWQQQIRVIAYLQGRDWPSEHVASLEQRLTRLEGIAEIRFVSKDEAMNRLKERTKSRPSLLQGLRENPLPPSFEMTLKPQWQSWEKIQPLIREIKSLEAVDDVEYGEAWLVRLFGFIAFFRLASLIIGGLLLATAAFVCANTIRLALYAKRDELQIMRLVGATDSFIKTPFYIQNLLEGFVGGVLALGLLFSCYRFFVIKIGDGRAWPGDVHIDFLSPFDCGALVLVGMAVACVGSFLSLRQVGRS